MPEQIQLRDKTTGKVEFYSPANARDLTTHTDRFEIVKTGSKPQEFRSGESPESEEYNLLGDRRVKDNRRVVEETGTSNTNAETGVDLAIGGNPDLIVATADETAKDDDDNETEDEDEDEDSPVNEQAPNGIVRSSSGELVDDELVTAIKDLDKTALVAYGHKHYGLDLDKRKSEDNLRLAIYDAAEKKRD